MQELKSEIAGSKYLLMAECRLNLICQLLGRTHGAVWAAVSPPSDPLSVSVWLFSSGVPHGSNQKWLVPTSTIPQNWTTGGHI